MSRRVEPTPRYYVSYRHDADEAIDTTVTPDEAFHRAAKHSKGYPFMLIVWDRDDRGKFRVRAFAHRGAAHWAAMCPKCKGIEAARVSCTTCDGLGAVQP